MLVPRIQSPLPQFAPRFTFAPALAWNDKIVVAFPRTNLGQQEVAGLHAALGQISDGGVFHLERRVPGRNHERLTTTKFASGRNRWLFGATVNVWPQRDAAIAQVILQLNPLRFFAHRWRYLGQQTPAVKMLHVNQRARGALVNVTADANDNFLDDQAIAALVETDWQFVLAAYFQHVTDLLDQQFRLASERRGLARFRWDNWTLRQIETAWEFHSLDARGHVEDFVMRASQVNARTTTDRINGYQFITIPKSANRQIVVYVKSDSRVRVELRHSKNVRNAYGRSAGLDAFPNATMADLARLISYVNVQAGAPLRALMLGTYGGTPDRSPVGLEPLVEALAHLHQATGQDNLAFQRIARALVHDGRVVEHPARPVRQYLDQLVSLGVLVRARTSPRERQRVYLLSSLYQGTFERIRTSLLTR